MAIFGLSTQKEVSRQIESTISVVANNLAKAGLYNEKLFAWINNNQPIFWEDNPTNYVQNGYQSNGDVYSCVDLILTKLAYCPLIEYTVKADKVQTATKYKALMTSDFAKAELFRIQTKAMTETTTQGIQDLINTPNKYQTTTEWLKQLAGFYLLTGNSYNYYNGLPGSKKWKEMYVLPAPLINIISGGDLEPVKGYNVFNSINYRQNVPDFGVNSVSHFKTFNPHFSTYGSQLYGQSPLRAYIATLVRNKDARIEQGKQIKNGGAFGILSPDSQAGAPAITDPKIKADLKKQLETAKNSQDIVSRLFVSGAPAKWLQIGLPSTDLQLLESLSLDRIDICNAYHINPVMLGNMNASTDNNMEWSAKQFVYNCVMTLGNTLTDKLTRDICTPYNTATEKKLLMFDYSVLPELQNDLDKIASALEKMYWVSVNEKREYQGWGRNVEPEADKILIPSSLKLLEDISLSDGTFTTAGDANSKI